MCRSPPPNLDPTRTGRNGALLREKKHIYAQLFAYTNLANPGLHIRREGTSIKLFLHPVNGRSGTGWVEFQCDLNSATMQNVCFMLFSFNENGSPGEFENDAFQRELPRAPSGQFPDAVWFASGHRRVVLADPLLATQSTLRVHLISQTRFRPAEMYSWDPVSGVNRRISQSGLDALGPVFDVNLHPSGTLLLQLQIHRQEGQQLHRVRAGLRQSMVGGR